MFSKWLAINGLELEERKKESDITLTKGRERQGNEAKETSKHPSDCIRPAPDK